ncbi:hypothetical protein IWX47DRAFT_285040 [Phyllosticta citricarpa]
MSKTRPSCKTLTLPSAWPVAAFHAPPTTCTTHSLTVGKCLQMHRRTYMRPGRRNPTSLQSQHLTSCSDNNDDKPCCRAIADRYSQRPARWRAASVRPPTNRQTDSCIWCLLYHQPAWTPYRWRGGASATCQTGAVSSPLPCLAEHFIGLFAPRQKSDDHPLNFRSRESRIASQQSDGVTADAPDRLLVRMKMMRAAA